MTSSGEKDRIAFKPAPRPAPVKRRTDIFSILIAGLVIGVLIVAVWISINAVIEKVRLSQGLRRIIEVVDTAREVAATDRTLGQEQADFIAIMEKLGRATPAGASGGRKALTNPWGGVVLAAIVPPDHIRIETVAPPYACRRIADLFAEDGQALGVEQIDARGPQEPWHRLYDRGGPAGIDDKAETEGCGHALQSDLVLTFSLR